MRGKSRFTLNNIMTREKKKSGNFNAGYLLGAETANRCLRNELATCKGTDETEFTKLGVAAELRDLDVKSFYANEV